MNKFVDILKEQKLQDMIVTGYVDHEEKVIFHPMYERLYFIFENCIYELYLKDGVIQFDKIEEIYLWFDLDEDDLFSLMSIYSQAFKTEYEIKILEVEYSNLPFSEMLITYIEVDEKRKLILDPKNFFGFTLF